MGWPINTFFHGSRIEKSRLWYCKMPHSCSNRHSCESEAAVINPLTICISLSVVKCFSSTPAYSSENAPSFLRTDFSIGLHIVPSEDTSNIPSGNRNLSFIFSRFCMMAPPGNRDGRKLVEQNWDARDRRTSRKGEKDSMDSSSKRRGDRSDSREKRDWKDERFSRYKA